MKKNIIAISLLFFSAITYAQESFEYISPPYEVYYSVFNSTFVTPDVAKAYQLTRGKDIAMVNVSVRKNTDSGKNIEKRAVVSGTKSDLIHVIALDFIEIEEKGAIYYLASFKFNHKEALNFNIEVQPDRNKAPINIKFRKALYQEGKK
ncbi:MAG: hypothetical protein ACJA0M_000768 [Chitinophagales bacterium]|jgi:hypothetical protein